MTNVPSPLRIATRGSQLARWQAEHVAALMRNELGLDSTISIITTSGDVNQTDRLDQMGGTGLFTKEVEGALIRAEADVAVHSLKDLPTEMEPSLFLAAVPPREDFRDVLVPPAGKSWALETLPHGARVATSSPRRLACLRHTRPDIIPVPIRGNIDTRLRKIDAGEADAIILAAAGLRRLGINRFISPLDPELFPAAPGQGALAIQARTLEISRILSPLNDPITRGAVEAEREVLRRTGGGCHSAVGVLFRPGWTVNTVCEKAGKSVYWSGSGNDLPTLIEQAAASLTS